MLNEEIVEEEVASIGNGSCRDRIRKMDTILRRNKIWIGWMTWDNM